MISVRNVTLRRGVNVVLEVIPPLLTRFRSRGYAAAISRCLGVTPPRPMLGRS